jgi:hypothetical protein
MAVLECVQEFFDCPVLKRVHRDDLVVREDDTDGDGDIVRIAVVKRIVFRRRFDHDHFYIVGDFKTGSFVYIERVLQKFNGNVQFVSYIGKLFLLERREDIHPGAILRIIHRGCYPFNIFK